MRADQQPRETSGLDAKLSLEIRDFLQELVEVAAASSLPYFRQPIDVENKSASRFDPVTVADRATEDAISDAILARFPDHGILGEERGERNPGARYRWVIDPIDGTRAFVCGLPTWATLVALCDGERPLVGMMSQPVVGEYFIGGGASARMFTGDGGCLELATSAIVSLDQASLFATAPEMFSREDEWPRFDSLSRCCRLTRFGVDSYAYCMLAAGFVDLVAEAGLGYYDVAALIPIIEAAGGVVTDWGGAPVRSGGTVLAAANERLHAAALASLSRKTG